MRVDLSTNVPMEAAAARLAAAIDHETIGYRVLPGVHGGRPYVGTIRGEEFDIHARAGGFNSFAPHLYVHIEPAPTGSRVVGEIRRTNFLRLGVIASVLIVTLVVVVLVLARPPVPELAFFAVALASLLLIGFGSTIGQEKELMRFLGEQFPSSPQTAMSNSQ